ncbi:DUF3817 domain-containing protein [Paenibacillus sp. SYP-B3998]|uniref:DUF3817 domain-containing protein n=1 Tax=Paenibacillus sp. SYP-B3998 TaxID=2678564 RepID=A0A6G4A3T0_9BACL|nr:DUF3817 domain-containing protein [Paenibacillus sp. SYP-B3998]NEW09123.1 DUF3817 domain-containing protein [Paenibacillus sp. SYP-B3998]
MLKRSLKFLHYVGLAEGCSFLLLLGIAMPLKYFMDLPQAVRLFGMAHGVLFVLYLIAVAVVTLTHRWPLKRVVIAVIAAFLPFGPFVLDGRLRKEQQFLK